jgi:hypothetical protein
MWEVELMTRNETRYLNDLAEAAECPECEHPRHAPGECEVERGDALVGEVLTAMGPCVCRWKEPPRWMGPAEYAARLEAGDLPPEGTYYTGERKPE